MLCSIRTLRVPRKTVFLFGSKPLATIVGRYMNISASRQSPSFEWALERRLQKEIYKKVAKEFVFLP